MTPEDNLEKYFKNVLNEDRAPSEENWSIPSDDLWAAAKVHFPKKKKRDRAIFFWFGLGLLSLLMGTGVASFLSQKTNPETATVITEDIAKNESTQTSQKNNNTIIPTTIEKVNASSQKELTTKQTNKQVKLSSSINPKKTNSRVKKSLAKTKTDLNDFIAVEPIRSDNLLETNQNKVKKESLDNPTVLDKSIYSTKTKVLSSLKKSIPFLEIPNRNLNLKDTLQNLTTPITPSIKKWEVGLSYAPFILLNESVLNSGSESNLGDPTVGIEHQNINFSIRRFIHPKYSISSGLYLSKGGIELAFCDKINYEENNQATLRNFINKLDATKELNLASFGQDFDTPLEYLPEVNLRSGEELDIKGLIALKIKFAQVPVLFNHHFGKRKFKGIVNAGFSLDYQHLKGDKFILGIFKEDNLLTSPLVVAPSSEHTLKVRWQAGFGLRYAIKDFLQVGSALKINISEPFLSRYDLGVYYGF